MFDDEADEERDQNQLEPAIAILFIPLFQTLLPSVSMPAIIPDRLGPAGVRYGSNSPIAPRHGIDQIQLASPQPDAPRSPPPRQWTATENCPDTTEWSAPFPRYFGAQPGAVAQKPSCLNWAGVNVTDHAPSMLALTCRWRQGESWQPTASAQTCDSMKPLVRACRGNS